MRRWLALAIGTALLALAGTALALAGSTEGDEDAKRSTAPTLAVEEKPGTRVEFEPLPAGMLVEDDLPESVPVEKEPVDETPPEIVILHPTDGQVFERREVVFEGEVEPGAKVYSGPYEAEVSESGAWRMVLVLDKGENTVTVKALDNAGNVGRDRVTVVYRAPEPEPKPAPREAEPKEETPKKEEPKEEEPKEEKPAEWAFSAKQLYGECSETPPYDVFHGTGKPGTVIHIESRYGGGIAEVGEKGGWEIKVIFESAPLNEAFAVHVEDQFGNHKVFEFVHRGSPKT